MGALMGARGGVDIPDGDRRGVYSHLAKHYRDDFDEEPPDIVIAEFFYGYGNNYAGANISNLDVFLSSLPKYAPNARVIVIVDPTERHYLEQLATRFPLHGVLIQPVAEADMEAVLALG